MDFLAEARRTRWLKLQYVTSVAPLQETNRFAFGTSKLNEMDGYFAGGKHGVTHDTTNQNRLTFYRRRPPGVAAEHGGDKNNGY